MTIAPPVRLSPRSSRVVLFFGGFDAAAEYGLVHTARGWAVGPLYQYAFRLNELKQPIVKAVVMSGWTWQPVITFFRPLGG